jgi:hypothetical protein
LLQAGVEIDEDGDDGSPLCSDDDEADGSDVEFDEDNPLGSVVVCQGEVDASKKAKANKATGTRSRKRCVQLRNIPTVC